MIKKNLIKEELKIERFIPIDRCLFWKEERTLIIGDLHLGYEEYLQEQGWSFPNTQLEESILLLEKILNQTGKLDKIILLGDVKHYFSGILSSEWSDFYIILTLLKKSLNEKGEIIIIKGNHDKILKPIIEKYKFVKFLEDYIQKDVLYFHGDKDSFKKNQINLIKETINVVVIAHFHPAISIRDSSKQEKYRCFLLGNLKNKKNIIIPSFFPLNEGTDILQEKLKLEDWFNISNYKVYIIADKIYDFGKVSKFLG